MANTTPNYNLIKPLGTEKYDVAVPNANMDNIDLQLKNLEDTKVAAEVGKGLSEENYTLIEKNKVANLPDDTIAQLAEKAQNFKIKNEVVNGSFEDNTNGWNISGLYDLLQLTNDAYIGLKAVNFHRIAGTIYLYQSCTGLANKKIYFNLYAKGTNVLFGIGVGTGNVSYYSTGQKNYAQYSKISGVITPLVDPTLNLLCYAGGNAYFDGVTVVDLTTSFGTGNEPTKLEMDELMKVIPNQWWDGELTLTQKQFITWQLNLIRKNTNAIIALGGTII